MAEYIDIGYTLVFLNPDYTWTKSLLKCQDGCLTFRDYGSHLVLIR